ncbi:MAG: homocysteine S-methyltransferase family protein [Anaerovoracaceae bacterium]|jgi:5-methyltetrahydrofolate--homocysteine methyltransferase
MKINQLIGKKLLFFDGAMGTILQSKGIPPGHHPELWNIEKPEIIKGIHLEYLDAGCHILKTNTFGANKLKFGKTPEGLIRAGIDLAREAIKESGREDAFVAFDMSSTGKLLAPLGDTSFQEAYGAFKEMVLAGNGADAILIETMTEIYELKAAVLAAKENSRLPVLVSVMLDEDGKLLTGSDVSAVIPLLEGLGVDAIGLNCGFGPGQMLPYIKEMVKLASVPVFVNPNAGIPVSVDGETRFTLDAAGFSDKMGEMATSGVWMMGGCCGTSPEHMEALIRRYKKVQPEPVTDKGLTVASSYTHAVPMGSDPRIVGEQLNPTGNKTIFSAVKEEDMPAIMDCALRQKEAGAHVIDVNIGVPGIPEAELLPKVVRKVQEVVDTPLMIDSSDPAAMEAALRIYNGKAIINSVNGKESSLKSVLPLAAKYGGLLVGLTMDDRGIPKTPEGRLEVAEKIVNRAATYGIPKKDILIDALTMAVSADPNAASVTLAAMKLIKEKLGVHTTLGVSNVSFGLPNRVDVTKTFYALALDHGLDAAIMDPGSGEMMSVYYGYRALRGLDESCLDYITFAKESLLEPTEKKEAKEAYSLESLIVQGMKDLAAPATEKLLKTVLPLDVIDHHIIPALAEVGDAFETGEAFLPQLLMSAEAAGNAFDVIKSRFRSKEGAEKGKIILATVKGDIHDIGKNIVKVLLESYGYRVIDLGRDVPPENIVEVAQRENVPLVGLSALMTTTVPSMKETIRQLREAGSSCKVVVGGAVLTEEYAMSIHADCYAKNAMATVRYAEKIFS